MTRQISKINYHSTYVPNLALTILVTMKSVGYRSVYLEPNYGRACNRGLRLVLHANLTRPDNTHHHLAVLVLVQINVELGMLLLHEVEVALWCAVYGNRRATQMSSGREHARVDISNRNLY